MTSEEDQFGLGTLIGGVFGKVVELFDEKDGKKKSAMKKIKLRNLSKDDRSSTEKETRLLTSLQNEYNLHVVTAFQEKETLCIVTEFCDQGDLAQFLEERKGESLDEQQIVEWFRHICSALEYLHGRNVLHRDIKTQNIFLTGNEMTAKLGDYDVTKVLESSTQKILSFCGSPYYIRPEIYAYTPYNCKTDILALGVCVYKMVATKLPFHVPQMQQLVFKSKIQLPPLPKRYSPELIEIIEKMMCTQTDRRPSSSELLQNVLFEKHSVLKVQRFLPNKKTTPKKISTYKDIDKIIRDTTMRINFNANREDDSYPSCKSTVSNSESFEASTSDTELSKASSSETSLEDSNENYFERTKTALKARFTSQLPSLAFTIMRSLFRPIMRSLMFGGAGSLMMTTEPEEFPTPLPRKENGRKPNESTNSDKKSLHGNWKENYTAENVERPKNQKRFWDKDLPNEKHLYEYFWKRHSVFSQWYPCKFTVDEITYISAEQYMMHQKAVLMDDKESAKIILRLNEPSEMKKIGRHVQNFNQELWESCCLDVVEKGNMAKFSQNEELRKELFNTYPKTLVEASPIDTIWGIGLSEKDKRAWNKKTWRGQNLLGEILTKVRNKLMELGPILRTCGTNEAEKGLVQQSD